ncbi:MAG: DMT family transporter [Nanoarchaeota archaeon]|nr:DMT family transporter [Nanoarchaeota archaeon]MCG2717464.1 DMT family transporter [Nanoarchaeota archaeon]
MNKKGINLIFLTALISGVSIFVNKLGVTGINPYIFTFGKNIIAMVFLFSMILLFKNFNQIKKLKRKEWIKLSVIGLLGGSIPFLLFFKGLSMTSGATAAFIHKTMFIYVVILASIFLKEKINKKILAGVFILMLGNLLLLKINNFAFNTGDLLVLVATLFWATENTISKYVLKTIPSKIVAFGRMSFGSLFILIFLVISGNVKNMVVLTTSEVLWIILTSGFLFLYVFTWYSGLKHVKVSLATSILLLGSPITTLLSISFLGTVITLTQLIGILLVPLGVLFVLKGYQPAKQIVLE